MKLVSFLRDGRPSFGSIQFGAIQFGSTQLGAMENGIIFDFVGAVAPGSTLMDILPEGLAAWQAMEDGVPASDQIALEKVTLLAPIPNPRKYLAIAGNYATHAARAETAGIKRAQGQSWFNKQVSCVNGPFDPVERPLISEMFDYEGELGVVIARDCRHVRAEDAYSVVAGYVVCNDLTIRDWQMRAPTHTLGKSFDTHGPFGPWIVTADEIADPHALMLKTSVNGEVRQQASTGDMTYKIPDMIAELTTAFTLQAGDILATGTPAGVGGLMDPPQFLKAGDRVRVEIERIGHIENVAFDEVR